VDGGAGRALGWAVDLLAAEGGQARMQPVLLAVRGDLRAGASLGDALTRQGAIFPEAYLRLVALAEGTGTLPIVLQRLHAGRTQARDLQRKLGSALVHPAFLLLVALAAMALIALAVVPQMRSVLLAEPRADGADAAIRRLIDVADWLTGTLCWPEWLPPWRWRVWPYCCASPPHSAP
jgi:type II secretory pathway component PulF